MNVCEEHGTLYGLVCMQCWDKKWDELFEDILDLLPEDTTMCKR